MPDTPIVACWIDKRGIVWSHDCEGKATPARAIPLSVVEAWRKSGHEVLRAIREKCSDYNDKIHPYNEDHHIEVTLTIGEIKRFHAALSLLEHTP